MEAMYTSQLRPLLDAVAQEMELYVPHKSGEHYVYTKYAAGGPGDAEFNDIRACMSAKDFLFPVREVAASFPDTVEPEKLKPFAVFGLKQCDLRSIEILDKVFKEDEFVDPFYVARRKQMFIISSDCTEPGRNCFCSVFGGKGHAEAGYDLNVSKIKDGYIIEAGSEKGRAFLEKNRELFGNVPDAVLRERDKKRSQVQQKLEQNNAEISFDVPLKEILEASYNSEVFDEEAKGCVECKACTRICPTCHCFYLYDQTQQEYFVRMKMWDSCMRMAYAQVAGGANPRKVLGDRIKHRLLHKFVYFVERYGIDMCVGCGRCIDAEAGSMDIRVVLKKLNEEHQGKQSEAVAE